MAGAVSTCVVIKANTQERSLCVLSCETEKGQGSGHMAQTNFHPHYLGSQVSLLYGKLSFEGASWVVQNLGRRS